MKKFLFTVNHCQQLYAPPNGSLEHCSNLPGQSCEFSCNKGYTLTGSTTRTCNSNGTWTGTPTQCNGNWPQLLFAFSIMILGEGLWGWVLWCGCISKRTRLVSPCHQLQFPYFKCSILIALKTKKVCVSFFSYPISYSQTSCEFQVKRSSQTLASISHCIFYSSRVKNPSFYCFEGVKLILLSWNQSSSPYYSPFVSLTLEYSCSKYSSHLCWDSLFSFICTSVVI